MTCWKILKIEPTKDIKAIKKAYSQLIIICHPEDNPEQFQILQQAYCDAMHYARNLHLFPSNHLNHQILTQNKFEK